MKPWAIIVLLCMVFVPAILYGQYENVWIFGERAGIDFNKNPPVPMSIPMPAQEACASVCDRNSNLCFIRMEARHLTGTMLLSPMAQCWSQVMPIVPARGH